MKETKDITALVVDYGNFICLADKLGQSYKKVYYYSPHETEYRDIKKMVVGTGVDTIERLDEPLAMLHEIDLFVFPDIGFTGLQAHLRSMGKPVWGSQSVTNIELYRSQFLDVLKEVGLPVPKSRIIHGLSELHQYLRRAVCKWVKVDVYRENMETWHHIDYQHSQPMLRYLADTFGGAAETICFIVQDEIPDAQENGYDGFCIDGQFPELSYQGYEKKNELYLGAAMERDELPENVVKVNEAMSPFLKKAGYRNFFATELRDEFFIDPTPRMAGQSQEHLLETMTNLADVMWAGANGELVEPEFAAQFAASATIHYKEVPGEQWKRVVIPQEQQRWFKLANYTKVGADEFNFPPLRNDEIGVVIGNGASVQAAIDAIKTHFEVIKDEPVEIELDGFVDLLKDIKKAQQAGIPFSSKPLPEPTSVLK